MSVDHEARNLPIGVFDSGVGGLSVLEALRNLLPTESFIYLADTQYVPYGTKSSDLVTKRAVDICSFFVKTPCKLIVIACNTATSAAVKHLRNNFHVPIVGIEPALKPATKVTQKGMIGILATAGTLESSKFSVLKNNHADGIEIIHQPCTGLVELVESGKHDTQDLQKTLRDFINPLIKRGIDTLVLGCTHYPLVRDLIEDIAGPNITILDPTIAVAKEVERQLKIQNISRETSRSDIRIFQTGDNPYLSKLFELKIKRKCNVCQVSL